MQEAKRLGMTDVLLHAQVHALGFYAKHGFVAEGPEFMECEMPHRQMRRGLADL
jgi:predicted GNAT family N-acyltransferase